MSVTRRAVSLTLSLCLAAVFVIAAAGVSSADPMADLTVSQVDTPDPVVGANTVEYKVTVKNNGPTASDPLMLSEYAYFYETDSESTIYPTVTVLGGPGWTCGDSEGVYCDHAGLGIGQTAVLYFDVLAPVLEGTIYHHVYVDSNTFDPDPYNNDDTEDTDVILDTTCGSGQQSCGTGHINYGTDGYVSTGFQPDSTEYFVGTTFFKGVAGAAGGQVWSMSSPVTPGRLCPTNLIGLNLFRCTFQMNLDPIPATYPAGNVTFIGICHVSRCPRGPAGNLTLIISEAGNTGFSLPLLRCLIGGLLPRPCFTPSRTAEGNLRVVVKNLTAGDPRIAGLCLGGGC